MTKVSASILSANLLKLGDELTRAENAGCDYIHVDVMDGNFVSNMAIGLCVAKWLPLGTKLRIDAHLAISNPQDYINDFADVGMHSILFHPESYCHHFRLIEQIRKRGLLVGAVLSPSTSIEHIKDLLPELDMINQLAVNAGFPNQQYNKVVNRKLSELKRLKEENNYHYEIQIDGGINESTADMAVNSGAEVLISGSSLFESADMAATVRKFKGIL